MFLWWEQYFFAWAQELWVGIGYLLVWPRSSIHSLVQLQSNATTMTASKEGLPWQEGGFVTGRKEGLPLAGSRGCHCQEGGFTTDVLIDSYLSYNWFVHMFQNQCLRTQSHTHLGPRGGSEGVPGFHGNPVDPEPVNFPDF